MYTPKSKIETNLFSSGELVIASTGEVYYGPYFKTFQGILYSGKEPNDGPNFILSTSPEESPDYPGLIDYRFTSKNSTYSNLTKVSRDSRPPLPIPFNPQPKDGDYQTGEITRFFAKKLNENVYYEVENTRVSSNPIYVVFSIQWLISGEESYVKETNQKMVELYMREFPIPTFNKFLKNDYLKFWKPN
jgi:hypothetical protein